MARDPRETELNDVTRSILLRDNYDPHFASIEQRVMVENRLFLARIDTLCRLAGVDFKDFFKPKKELSFDLGKGAVEIARGRLTGNLGRPPHFGDTVIIYRDSESGTVWAVPEDL